MKRLLALVAGGLGLRALLRRRSRPGLSTSQLSPSPAEDLRAKLAQTKVAEPEPAPAAASEPQPAPEPEPEPEPAAAQPETVEDRRADVHEKARQAIDDLSKN
jgi:predicted Zn-dependent protease